MHLHVHNQSLGRELRLKKHSRWLIQTRELTAKLNSLPRKMFQELIISLSLVAALAVGPRQTPLKVEEVVVVAE
jgi:hypothetical protein